MKSEQFEKVFVLAVATVVVMGGAIHSACAATLTTNAPVLIGSNSGHDISVYPGKAAYDGLASGIFGDGTVLDYRFFNNATIASGGYANGGGSRVSDITSSGGLTDYEMARADVWTVIDPGTLTEGIPDFSSSADFGGADETMSGRQIVNGTIDISGLVTGVVYVLCGSYQSTFSVTLTMSGAGQSDIEKSVTVVPPTSRNKYVCAFVFEDALDHYESIRYNYTGTNGNRARFMGVILDGEAAAGVILWSGEKTANIGLDTADVSALVSEDLTDCILVWDIENKGDTNTTDWTYSRVLGPTSAGAVAGQITNLTADTAYTWRFYGTNAMSEAWTVAKTFPTALTSEQAPLFTNTVVEDQTLDVTLGWKDNAATETDYVLLRSTNGVDYTFLDSVPAPAASYVDTVPTPGIYYYQLAVTNTVNSSGTDPSLCATHVTVANPAIYVSETVLVDEAAKHMISVYPGKAKYAGNRASGDFGDGTVADYRFFNNATTNDGYAAGSAGLIRGITYSGSYPYNLDYPQVWTLSDPDTHPANFTNATMCGFNSVTGTVDIDDLSSGQLYFLCGGYDRDVTVALTMTGAGQTPKTASVTFRANASRNTYSVLVLFENASLAYQTISYTYTCGKGRFLGVVLDATLPPPGTVLIVR